MTRLADRSSGDAEVASHVLHNLGNVLNTMNVSVDEVRRALDLSRLDGLRRAVDLLNQHRSDLPAFFAADPRGAALLPYLDELVAQLASERAAALEDLERLARGTEHIIYLVTKLQSQSQTAPSGVRQQVDLEDFLREAILLCDPVLSRFGASAELSLEGPIAPVALDRQLLLQVLVNLVKNAAEAVADLPPERRRISVHAAIVPGPQELHLRVADAGAGIAPEHLPHVFSHGFTTRSDGHGFGLHSSALAAEEMGGRLSVQSEGLGKGALFSLVLPLRSA